MADVTASTSRNAWVEPMEGIRDGLRRAPNHPDRELIERDGTRIVGERVVPVVQYHHYLVIERDCLNCAEPFRVLYVRYSKDRRYCSDACRQAAYRKRKCEETLA